MKTVIYFPPTPGCENSARVLGTAVGSMLREQSGTIKLLPLPHRLTRAALAGHASAGMDVDCAFFIERIIDHPALMRAKHRILIPNPEWLDDRTQVLAAHCTQLWHKTRYSLEHLAPVFPQARHAFVGFSSQDPGRLVTGYDSFVHLRGNVLTQRNTDSVFAAWKTFPKWPDLYVQFYVKKDGGPQYPGWLHDGNVHVRMGWLGRAEYLELAGQNGIHLCTSEVEGFGHYIDEARAMGALVITVDGSPMNELVDEGSGILVRPSNTSVMNHGVRYHITPEDLAPAIDRALSLSTRAKRELGAAARERFVKEGRHFHQRARELFAELHR